MTETLAPPPEVGQAVRVRNRLALVRAVEPYDSRGPQGRLNLVQVEYLDDCRYPESDDLLWEVEPTATVLGTTSLPSVDANRPDNPSALRAFVNAHRWTRLNRLRQSAEIKDEPLLGVWNSAIQVHPYQLEPVLRALEMTRVSLLLSDGTGLGKTVQAGLVLEELLLRRRIRRVLVICPAMLQRQWQAELSRKFNLDFEVIDSDTTFQLRRRLGIDTNPWKAFPRIITSMDYLRMPDVLQQFLQGSGVDANRSGSALSPHAPWDLLIVDEAHHFAPQGGNRASQRTRMMRDIRFLFEHRLFASATPHNGKTVCFTGLLELLDPVRFQMVSEMDSADHKHLSEVRVRRLKETINRQSLRPPFAEELPPVELEFKLSPDEGKLFQAVRAYREKAEKTLHGLSSKSTSWLSQFVFSLLTKRLLSCPYAFARTWWRHVGEEAQAEKETLYQMARVSAERAEDTAKNDDERSSHEEDAVGYAGAVLSQTASLEELRGRVGDALVRLGYDQKTAEDGNKLAVLVKQSDSKTEALVRWVKEHLFTPKGKLREDERLIVFTEYKETLLYLEKRFLREGFDENTLRLLYGGMSANEFETVKGEFEDPASDVRLLLATDAASEGINMQESCRWVLHFDIPWSPSKILQRNGRVARHGQTREVSTHYFRCDEEEDLKFFVMLARKVQQIGSDLGSVERVFNSAIQSHFEGRKTSEETLSLLIEKEQQQSTERKDLGQNSEEDLQILTKRARELLESTDAHLGISPNALTGILRAAIAVEGGGSLDEISGNPGFYRLKPPPKWEGLVRQTLTVRPRSDRMELVFDSALVEKDLGKVRVLRLKKHQVLMRLGHPVMRQAMATLSRQLHDPNSPDPIYRWSLAALHHGGFEALLVFHFTTTAINELREPLHDEVMSEVFRVEGDRLSPVDDSFRDEVLRSSLIPVKAAVRRDEWMRTLRPRWARHRAHLEWFLSQQQTVMKSEFQVRAKATLKRETQATAEGYTLRLKELEERTREKELKKIAEALLEEQIEAAQLVLFGDMQQEARAKVEELEQQMMILRKDVDQTRKDLTRERDHRLKELLPKRFEIRDVRVLPLAIEYVIPATGEDLKA